MISGKRCAVPSAEARGARSRKRWCSSYLKQAIVREEVVVPCLAGQAADVRAEQVQAGCGAVAGAPWVPVCAFFLG